MYLDDDKPSSPRKILDSYQTEKTSLEPRAISDEKSAAISQFNELETQIKNFDLSPIKQYLNLAKIACRTEWYPSDEMELKIYGQERMTAIQVIRKTRRYDWGKVYENMGKIRYRLMNDTNRAGRTVEENQLEDKETPEEHRHRDVTVEELLAVVAEMKEWLTKMPVYVAGEMVIVAIVKDVIVEQASRLQIIEATNDFKTNLSRVLSEIVAAHDKEASVRDRGSHCYLLFNDGEIISTKAGEDLFLARSLFTIQPTISGLSRHLFTFPETWHGKDGYNYVIVAKESIAIELRNKMLELYGLSLVPSPYGC